MITKKDMIYILIITLLLATMFVQYSSYQNDSYTRVMDCFKDEVKEPEFCQKFYKQYLE
jgi:ABC-type cobalt transport system substrate-binding protein